MKHHYATVNGLRLHYVTAGSGDPLLLIHGFPQTWYEWRTIIPRLAERFTVIAPDYRGAGDSDRPQGGYDKITMMEDLRGLVQQLGFRKVRVAGHDAGAMVAYPYAALHPDEVEQLVLMDAPVPGTEAFTNVRNLPRAWHINFHSTRDLPERLVEGRERDYLTTFFKSRFTTPNAISQEDMDVYINAYSSPGGMRCGFEVYRAMAQDCLDNAPYLEKKLPMPVLVLGGEMSASGPSMQRMTDDIAAKGEFKMVRGAGHWLCEQNPEEVLEHFFRFFGK